MLPKVTIYILNYNYGRFISKAIESCVSQSFKQIEIIIIDDGSTDDSKKIINLHTQKYPSLICKDNDMSKFFLFILLLIPINFLFEDK